MSSAELLPLERLLRYFSENHKFPPNNKDNYFDRYIKVKDWLTANVFKDTDLVVAYKDNKIMTSHGLDHCNAVITKAGELLRVNDSFDSYIKTTPYETYILLMSIILHDAGMLAGREDHGFKLRLVIPQMVNILNNDKFEQMRLCKIVESHQGTTLTGSSRTLEMLNNQNKSINDVREGLLGAILRFSDEISEDYTRANKLLIDINQIPNESKIHHYYALSVASCTVADDGFIDIQYLIGLDMINKTFPWDGNDVYLLDWICKKVLKINRERLYCMEHMYKEIDAFGVRATITIIDSLLVPVRVIELSKKDWKYLDADDDDPKDCAQIDVCALCKELLGA